MKLRSHAMIEGFRLYVKHAIVPRFSGQREEGKSGTAKSFSLPSALRSNSKTNDVHCAHLSRHVIRCIQFVWKRLNLHHKVVLNVLKYLFVSLLTFVSVFGHLKDRLVHVGGDEGHSESLGTETSSTTNTMQVRVYIIGHIVVNDNVHLLDINSTSSDIGGNQDSLVEILELGVILNTLLLAHTTVDADRWELHILGEKLVQLLRSWNSSHKDYNLIVLESIEERNQLFGLLLLWQLNVVLLESVQRELLLVNLYVQCIVHEFLCNCTHIIIQSGGEHHHLLVARSALEDLLYSHSHGCISQELVTLIQDKVSHL
mmetsp:Transcript_5006/g.18790  ORF Transcript_5006/g.18790 Transcript_5006/m.18790 type:complete len:315 (-) Transcript_5006:625-1569(-)